jgi:hypothetical protein
VRRERKLQKEREREGGGVKKTKREESKRTERDMMCEWIRYVLTRRIATYYY